MQVLLNGTGYRAVPLPHIDSRDCDAANRAHRIIIA